MIRIWAKIIKDEKILKDIIYEESEKDFNIKHFAIYMMDICDRLDIETPVLLSKHVQHYYLFNMTKFNHDDFLNDVDFDSLVIESAVLS